MFTFSLYWFDGEPMGSGEESPVKETPAPSKMASSKPSKPKNSAKKKSPPMPKKKKAAQGENDRFGRLTEDVSFSWDLDDDEEILDMLFPAQHPELHQYLWENL